MDLIFLTFLLILVFIFIGVAILTSNPAVLMFGGFLLLFTSAIVHVEGYDVDYNPTNLTVEDNFTYDENQLLTRSEIQLHRINANNNISVFGITLVGMILGSLLALMGAGFTMVRNENASLRS